MDATLLTREEREPIPAGGPPVTLIVDQPYRSSRLLLFVKWLCYLPLLFWIFIYGIVASLCAFIAFWAILFTGRYPLGLFEFVRGYLEAQWRAYSYFPLLTSDRWRTTSPSPVNLYVRPPEKLSRLNLLFLKLPFFITSGVNSMASFGVFLGFLIATPAWFAILISGKYPRGPFRVATTVSQWAVRLSAWQFMMSDDWRLLGETMLVRVLTIIGALLFAAFTVTTIVLAQIRPSGVGSFTSRLLGIDKAQAVVTDFMAAGRDNRLDDGLALVDPTAINKNGVQQIFSKRQYFDGFRDTKIRSFHLETRTGRSSLILLFGDARYEDGHRTSFDAYLVKYGGRWYLQFIESSPAPR